MVTSLARGRLRLSLRPSPRPRLILTSCTDVVLVTMDLDTSDTMAMDSDTHTTARGLLMLRPSLPCLWRTWTLRIWTGTWTPRILWPWTRIRRTPRIWWTPRIRRIWWILLGQIDYIKIFHRTIGRIFDKKDCYQFEVPFTSAAVSVLPY